VLTGALAERRRRRAIERLRDHYIICGYGRVGRRAAAEFRREGAAFLVLDFSDDAIETAREAGVLLVEGTGTEDEAFDATPAPAASLEVGDVMSAAGAPDELRRLEELFAPAEAVA
jgi:voltage-gated potassium channel